MRFEDAFVEKRSGRCGKDRWNRTKKGKELKKGKNLYQ